MMRSEGRDVVGPALCLLAACLLIPDTGQAASFTAFEPRSLALGGAGVALTGSYNAPLYNPALLAYSRAYPKRAFVRPFAGARLIDRDDFRAALDRYHRNENEDRLDTAVIRFNARNAAGTVGLDDADTVLDSGQALLDDLGALSDRPLRLAASTGVTAGHSDGGIGFALTTRRTWVGGSIIDITPGDRRLVQEVLTLTRDVLDAIRSEQLPTDFELPRPMDEFTSSLTLRGAIVTETVMSGARRFGGSGGLAVGLNLKIVDFQTIAYRAVVDDARAGDFHHTDHAIGHQSINADLGLAWRPDERLRFALSVRDVLLDRFETKLGDPILSRPQVRAGLAWIGEDVSVALDLDLSRNDPVGFDPDTQYLSFGVEVPTGRHVAWRFGYREERVTSRRLLSMGAGLAFDHVHLDLGFAGRRDEFGAAIQAGIRF